MNDTKHNAKRALTLTTVLTLFVAGAEMILWIGMHTGL